MNDAAETIRRRVALSGVVQGVGFRPFVWRRATRLGLAGWVENDSAGVVLDLPPLNVATFRERISGGANQGRARDATR
ncbi:MAG: acylphosphatase, partial [Planctomycetota bacterium]